MKKTIFIYMLVLYGFFAYGQDYDHYLNIVDDRDTIVVIPSGSQIVYCSPRKSDYILRFYVDRSIYELDIAYIGSEMILFHNISWGNYKVKNNKVYFRDRVAGFKMKASKEGNEIRFHQDYFPNIDNDVWDISPPEINTIGFTGGFPDFFAVFDDRKARKYRKEYNKKYLRQFEFEPGIYSCNRLLEIGVNGEWRLTDEHVTFAEGSWCRKRNTLLLKCPKLKCTFHMVILEKGLKSTLLLGDFFGMRYVEIRDSEMFDVNSSIDGL